uniref:Uncharacterized protein n=1 Tax=Lepeophtheirus salmonis TaxID=72036 RepID=A0A0K2UXY8_LEPSM
MSFTLIVEIKIPNVSKRRVNKEDHLSPFIKPIDKVAQWIWGHSILIYSDLIIRSLLR